MTCSRAVGLQPEQLRSTRLDGEERARGVALEEQRVARGEGPRPRVPRDRVQLSGVEQAEVRERAKRRGQRQGGHAGAAAAFRDRRPSTIHSVTARAASTSTDDLAPATSVERTELDEAAVGVAAEELDHEAVGRLEEQQRRDDLAGEAAAAPEPVEEETRSGSRRATGTPASGAPSGRRARGASCSAATVRPKKLPGLRRRRELDREREVDGSTCFP